MILGLVVVDNEVKLISPHLLPCWQKFNRATLAQLRCEEAVAKERRASGL